MFLWMSAFWRWVTKKNETILVCKDKQSKMTPSPVQGKLTVLLEDVTCYRATENEEKVVGRTMGGEGGKCYLAGSTCEGSEVWEKMPHALKTRLSILRHSLHGQARGWGAVPPPLNLGRLVCSCGGSGAMGGWVVKDQLVSCSPGHLVVEPWSVP